MRAVALAFAFALAIGGAGCLGQGTVRAVLLDERIALDENAPASAWSRIPTFLGCAPAMYEPGARTIHLTDRGFTPRFAVVLANRGGHPVMTAGDGGGPFDLDLGVLSERGTSGSWGQSSPFQDAHFESTLDWNKEGVRFDDAELAPGASTSKTSTYQATWDNATFNVTHTFHVTYLGRVAYEMDHVC